MHNKPVNPLQTNAEAQCQVSQVADDQYDLFILSFLFGLIVLCRKCHISLESFAGLCLSSQCFQVSFYEFASLEKEKHNILLSCTLNYILACFGYHFKKLFYFYIIRSLALWGLFMIPWPLGKWKWKLKKCLYGPESMLERMKLNCLCFSSNICFWSNWRHSKMK